MKKNLLAFSIASGIALLSGCMSNDSSNDVTAAIESAAEEILASEGNTGATMEETQTTNTTSSAFPSGLALASPTSIESTVSTLQHTSSGKQLAMAEVTAFANGSMPKTAYANAVNRINNLLSGSTPLSDTFTPELFYSYGADAACYGPTLRFENHPDSSENESGELPSGDLGLWHETENETDEACVAAQLNARMQGIKDRSFISLMTVASMIKAYEDAGNTFPADIENQLAAQSSTPAVAVVEDLTAIMQDLSIDNVTIHNATIALDANGEQWTYTLVFTYMRGGNDLNIEVQLIHVPGENDNAYEGLLTYRADDNFAGGNCDNLAVSNNGSLHYKRTTDNTMILQSRSGQFCEHGTNGLTESVPSDLITDNVVDSTAEWGNNFSIFTAEFALDSMAGSYSYAWQAGRLDSNTRILNIDLTSATEGVGYFGFGDTIDTTDGSIQGFICNWAGPGNDHNLIDYAQRQNISFDNTMATFEPSESLITYAPVSNCVYDGSGAFAYDRDLDNDLSDETVTTINVGSGEALEFSLMGIGDEETIWDAIQAGGFELPAYPLEETTEETTE